MSDVVEYRAALAATKKANVRKSFDAQVRLMTIDAIMIVLRQELKRCRVVVTNSHRVQVPLEDLIEAGKNLANYRSQLERAQQKIEAEL